MTKEIKLSAIGQVKSTRTEIKDDLWDSETAYLELDHKNFTSEALAGLSDFSHAEIIFFMNQVDPAKVEKTARHPRNNIEWPKVGVWITELMRGYWGVEPRS